MSFHRSHPLPLPVPSAAPRNHRSPTPRSVAGAVLTGLLTTVAAAQGGVIDPAVAESYGSSCGPTLQVDGTVLRTSQELEFRVNGAVPAAPSALFFGVQAVDWPLPGSICRLLTDPITAVPITIDGTGAGEHSMLVPGTSEGRFFAQAVSLDFATPTIETSNGLDLILPGMSPTADPTAATEHPCYYVTNLVWNYGGDGVPSVTGQVRWPSDACSAASGPPADRPVLVFLHGNAMSHTDHDYLMAFLARNGFVTCSISNGGFDGGSNEGRARQAISFLNGMHAFWGFNDRLSNDVVFVGHSRGGEAAITAARLLRDQPSLGHISYDVRSVISIAPTDGGGDNSDPKEVIDGNVTRSFLGIYGSRDPDVLGVRLGDPMAGPENTVFAIYDRAGTEGSVEGLLLPQSNLTKAMVFVEGATHRGFLDADTCSPLLASVVSCSEHRDIAMAYCNAFLRWHVFGESDHRDYFTGEATPTRVRLAGNDLFHQFSDVRRRVVDNFEQGGLGTNTRGGTLTFGPGIAQIAENELYQLDPSVPHDTRGVRIKWSNSGTSAYVRWNIPNDSVPFVGPSRDVSGFDVLSFRIAQDYLDAWNTPGEDQDFYVQLETSLGTSNLVRVGAHGRVPYPDPLVFSPYPQPAGDYTKSAMTTVRIPLQAFFLANTTDVRAVTFRFTRSGNEIGSVVVDSLEFAN